MAEITVGSGGWLIVRDPGTGLRAYVRFDLAADGRLYPGALVAQAQDEGGKVRELRGADLRTFPLAHVEAEANGQLRDRIIAKIDNKLELRFQGAGGRPQSRPGGGRATVKTNVAPSGELAPGSLDVPATRPYPDEFYAEVARAYTEVARSSQRPAVEIAEAAEVPPRTVHRWVAEARRRGLLAPGRKGKVG